MYTLLFFENENQRRRAVAWVVALATTLPTATQRNEYHFQPSLSGEPVPPEAGARPEMGVYRVLYRSSATKRPSNQELRELLEEARQFNREH